MRGHRATAVGLLAWTACALTTCQGTAPTGQLGTFTYTATPVVRDCVVAGLGAAPFTFAATVGLAKDGGAVVTLRGYERPATWAEQVAVTTESARRTFADCASCDVVMEETLELGLFSPSQAQHVGGTCPADNAVPTPKEAIRPLDVTGATSDAVLSCGALTTRLDAGSLDGGDCSRCMGCFVKYQLVGQRQ